jgi:predicted adenine nucleotide alpha hydrolase (AANH) superfamily ATPase
VREVNKEMFINVLFRKPSREFLGEVRDIERKGNRFERCEQSLLIRIESSVRLV